MKDGNGKSLEQLVDRALEHKRRMAELHPPGVEIHATRQRPEGFLVKQVQAKAKEILGAARRTIERERPCRLVETQWQRREVIALVFAERRLPLPLNEMAPVDLLERCPFVAIGCDSAADAVHVMSREATHLLHQSRVYTVADVESWLRRTLIAVYEVLSTRGEMPPDAEHPSSMVPRRYS